MRKSKSPENYGFIFKLAISFKITMLKPLGQILPSTYSIWKTSVNCKFRSVYKEGTRKILLEAYAVFLTTKSSKFRSSCGWESTILFICKEKSEWLFALRYCIRFVCYNVAGDRVIFHCKQQFFQDKIGHTFRCRCDKHKFLQTTSPMFVYLRVVSCTCELFTSLL